MVSVWKILNSRVSTSKISGTLVLPTEHRSQPSSTFSMLVQCVLYTVQSIVFCLDMWMVPRHLGQCLAFSTNLCWLNEWRWRLCLSYLYCLHQGMCSLLIQPLYRIICEIIELAKPLYKNNCYTTGCWLDPFYGMTWKSLKTWKIVYFSSDLDKSIIYKKFKAINWSFHCNYLYYCICDEMLGRKHLKTLGWFILDVTSIRFD